LSKWTFVEADLCESGPLLKRTFIELATTTRIPKMSQF
jgi:hypothetical protein